MRIVAIALVLAGCFSKPPRPDGGGDDAPGFDGPTADGWLTGYLARKRFDLDPPSLAAPLVDFPIVIAPAAPDDQIAMRASSSGADLVVTDDNGVTVLPSELVSYAGGTFEIWFKHPRLDGKKSVYLYYGGPTVQPDPATWAAPFVGVWHMSGTAGEADHTSHGLDLAAAGPSTPTTTAGGAIGAARTFDGADTMSGGKPSELDFGTTSFSYSLWANVPLPTQSDFGTGFFKGGTNSTETGYCWLMGNQLWTTKLTDPIGFVEAEIGDPANFGNRWVHLTTVVDRTARTLTAYVDGIQRAGNSIPMTFGSMTTLQQFELSHNSGGQAFKGSLDEIHIYHDVLTADWIATEHANQSNAPGFLTVQPEELAP